MRTRLLPQLDQTLSALIEDLDSRGQLDNTMVYCASEFGRTPNINRNAGRDHEAIRINGAGGSSPQFADRDNFPFGDPDVAPERGHAGAIDDAAVLNQEIIGHGRFLLVMRHWVVGQRARRVAETALAL